LLLLLFSLLLYVPGISKLPVIDRDEAHFAQASKQMLQTNNYFQIRFQDTTRFQKPPGINWLQAGSVKLLSSADSTRIWPYRIPSTCAALLSVLLTYFFSRRFVRSTTAAIAAGMLASSLLLVVEAHMAVIDAALLLSVLLMQGSLWIIYQAGMDKKSVHWVWPLCFWLAMSFGFVLKGVGPLIGLLSLLTLCIIEKRVNWLKGLRICRGLLLFTSLNLMWLALVNDAEHSNYLMQMINKDLLPKLQGSHESHGQPPLFHLFILPLTFWPASLFLWPGGVYAWKNRHTHLVKFLLAWLLPTWIFFECMPTKLPQYVLPLFPALSLLCALAIENQCVLIKPGKWVRVLQILWAGLSIGIALSLAMLPYLLMKQINFTGLFLLLAIAVLTGIAIYYARKGDFQHEIMSVFILAIITFPLVFHQLLPQLKPVWFTTTLAEFVDKNQISRENPLLVAGFEEPSLVFNLNTHLVKFIDKTEAMEVITHDPGRLALVEASTFKNWADHPATLAILAQIQGYDYSKGKWVDLVLVGRNSVLGHWRKQHAKRCMLFPPRSGV